MYVSRIPFSNLSTYEDPDEQLDTFNKLFLSVVDGNAPLKRVEIIGIPVPWMKHLQIDKLQKKINQLQYKALLSRTTKAWTEFRKICNELKNEIKKTELSIYQKALSSEYPKEIW